MRLGAAAVLACALASCTRGSTSPGRAIAPASFTFAVDTFRQRPIDRGINQYFVYATAGPWAIHVLDVRLDRCYSAVAAKGAAGAVGRRRTSEILRELRRTHAVVAGVNGDFFLFTPAGVPSGALIAGGRVITGPSAQPVFAVDSLGRPALATLATSGQVLIGGRRFVIGSWNRPAPSDLALFDAGWGDRTDTLSGAVEVAYGGVPARVTLVDTAASGVAIPADGGVLVLGRSAPDSVRSAFLQVRSDLITVAVNLTPIHPREAVGGRPRLVRDSVIVGEVDTIGGPGFADGRHPRTAVGIASGGRRLVLVAVDGRQAGYSAGMTLRELASLMLSLGAPDALNLDGGGSTTMVIEDPETRQLDVVNRPSDSAGERPAGNALAIVRGCGGR